MEYRTDLLGSLGEKYVKFKLAQIEIDSITLPYSFDFDIYTNNNLRLEIKTSNKRTQNFAYNKNGKKYSYERNYWGFNNYKRDINKKMVKRNRDCDFFILLCIEKYEFKSYIVPKSIIKSKRTITIYDNKTIKDSLYSKYLERWDLLKVNPLSTFEMMRETREV